MAKPSFEQYTDEVHRSLNYLAAWPPTSTLNLGDVGVFQNREFEPNTTLTNLGLDFDPSSGENLGTLGFASEGAVNLSASSEAAVADPVGAGLARITAHLRFTRANAVFFRAERSVLVRIDDLDALKDAVLGLEAAGNWKREWRVVTQVIRSESCLVMVSGSREDGAEVVVHANALPTPMELARGSAEIEVSKTFAMALSFGPGGPGTPLFQAYRIASRALGGKRTKRVDQKGRLRPPAEVCDEQVLDFLPHSYDTD